MRPNSTGQPGITGKRAPSTHATWKNVSEGRSGIARIEGFDATEFASQIAGECSDFEPLQYMPKRRLREGARFIQLAIAASAQAIKSSGFDPTDEEKE